MNDYESKEIFQFLKDKIPIVLDIEKQELKYDTNNIYYKIYRYIHKLKEENKELREKK